MILKCSSMSRSSQGRGHIKITVIQGQGYLMSWPLKVEVIQVHSHFEVKVILESNGNVFRFLSRRGRLASSECLSLLVWVICLNC